MTSGALATLLFGVSAFAIQAEKVTLSAAEAWLLISRLVFSWPPPWSGCGRSNGE
jgi:hypothetical protein